MRQEVKRSIIGIGLMGSVVLRVAAVLLAVQYVGLSYALADAYDDLLWVAQWIMPDLLWCVLWFFVLPLLEERLVDWFEEDQEETTPIGSGISSMPGEH